jgi:rhamnosyltransferase
MTSNTPSPRILVLLATFNGEKWIEEQMDSILRQKDVNVHVVVGDDASTDNTLKVLACYGAERLTIVKRESSGGSASQNFFGLIRDIDASEFDFVAFSDQDDIWNPNKLSRACQALQDGDCSGYASATTAFWTDGTQKLLKQNPTVTESDYLFEGAGQGCTYVLTVGFYSRARRFISDLQAQTRALHYHDWALYALARAWRLQWAFDPESTIQYRQHLSNDTGAKLSVGGMFSRLRRLANGWYGSQIAHIQRFAAAANPSDPIIHDWGRALSTHRSLERRFRVAHFCVRGGRRKVSDNAVLICSALLGWI